MFKNIKHIKAFILTCALVFTFIKTNAQQVRVIDNKGTKQTVNNNSVTTSTTAPINPVENDIWFDNSNPTNILTKIYDADTTTWIEVPTTNTQTVYTGFFIIPNGSGGNQNITGVPFQPSQITFVAHANIESLNINSDNGVGNNNSGINNSFGTMHGFARNNGATVTQQVIYLGGSGNSINDISRYSSNSNCIGLRYGNQNGNNLGVINASLTSFNTDGFSINVSKSGSTNPESVVVLYTAYR